MIRISRLSASNEIKDHLEKEKLEYLINTKKLNPYCLRHSSITSDSDYLPDFALKKKVRWSMNSRQGSRYIKTRMGNELRTKILEHNGIVLDHQSKLKKDEIINIECPRCALVNVAENKFCLDCSYPLTIQSYEELKKKEDEKIRILTSRLDEYEVIQKEGRIMSKEIAQKFIDIKQQVKSLVFAKEKERNYNREYELADEPQIKEEKFDRVLEATRERIKREGKLQRQLLEQQQK